VPLKIYIWKINGQKEIIKFMEGSQTTGKSYEFSGPVELSAQSFLVYKDIQRFGFYKPPKG
jgi:hypothetical protein